MRSTVKRQACRDRMWASGLRTGWHWPHVLVNAPARPVDRASRAAQATLTSAGTVTAARAASTRRRRRRAGPSSSERRPKRPSTRIEPQVSQAKASAANAYGATIVTMVKTYRACWNNSRA